MCVCVCVCVCVCHVTASSAGSSRRLFFVRMFFNPSFTKPSHVASVLCECLEMASRRCLLAACAGRSSSSPFFRPPVPPLHHGLLGTSFSIRLALPFRIVPFALHSVTSMAVRLCLGGALDTVASTSTSLSPSPSPPSPVPRFASLVAFPLPPRVPPSPSLLWPFAILLLLRVAPPSPRCETTTRPRHGQRNESHFGGQPPVEFFDSGGQKGTV